MLALISPAKTLDYDTPLPTDQFTQARLLEHSQDLIERLSHTFSNRNFQLNERQ